MLLFLTKLARFQSRITGKRKVALKHIFIEKYSKEEHETYNQYYIFLIKNYRI
jgi:hypothetical protein